MRNLEFNDGTNNWVQVQKRTAKKLFEAGQELVFCPCNMRPFGVWSCGILMDANRYKSDSFETSDANFD